MELRTVEMMVRFFEQYEYTTSKSIANGVAMIPNDKDIKKHPSIIIISMDQAYLDLDSLFVEDVRRLYEALPKNWLFYCMRPVDLIILLKTENDDIFSDFIERKNKPFFLPPAKDINFEHILVVERGTHSHVISLTFSLRTQMWRGNITDESGYYPDEKLFYHNDLSLLQIQHLDYLIYDPPWKDRPSYAKRCWDPDYVENMMKPIEKLLGLKIFGKHSTFFAVLICVILFYVFIGSLFALFLP